MPNTQDPHVLLSIADIARHFSLPESSIRYYCKRFEPFFSSVGDGRKRRFHVQALDIIQAVLDQMPKVRTAKAVEAYLLSTFPQTVIADAVLQTEALGCETGSAYGSKAESSTKHTAPALYKESSPDQLPQLAMHILDRQTQALDTIATSLEALVQRQESFDALTERAEKAEEEAQSLRGEIETLRLLLNSSEKTQQADLDQLRTWLGKILQNRKIEKAPQ